MRNDVDALSAALRESREYTVSLVAHLDEAQWEVPYGPTVNPLRWEVGHIGFFQEFFCLRWQPDDPAGARTPSCRPDADALFDSRAIAHAARWSLPLPSRQTIHDYLDQTLDRTLSALRESGPEERERFCLALLHEDMHGEAILMTLQSVGLAEPPRPRPVISLAPADLSDVRFDGGRFQQGSPMGSLGYVFDNEKWAHEAVVAPFSLASRPVSQGEFADFVDDGGYGRRELWSAEGWQWREASQAKSPVYWRREDGQWLRRWFGVWSPLKPEETMVHVNRHEAEAWCRWAGRRLPSESEWEFAATGGGKGWRYPWGDEAPREPAAMDHRMRSPAPGVTPQSAAGLPREMMGGVWEWTSSTFAPYPGFEPDAYEEYSQPFFGTHGVLRGGSFVTRSRLVHARWRNFYAPERRDAFAGFRTCARVA